MQFSLYAPLFLSALLSVAASPIHTNENHRNHVDHISNLETEAGQHRFLCYINQVRNLYGIPPLQFDSRLHEPVLQTFSTPEGVGSNEGVLLKKFGIEYDKVARVETQYCSYIDQCVGYLFKKQANVEKLLSSDYNKAGLARWDEDNDDHVAVMMIEDDGTKAGGEDEFCSQLPLIQLDQIKVQK